MCFDVFKNPTYEIICVKKEFSPIPILLLELYNKYNFSDHFSKTVIYDDNDKYTL